MDKLDIAGGSFCTTVSGLVGVNGATTLTTAAAALFCIDGKAYSKAAATGGASPTLDSATGVAFKPVPPGYASVFVVGSAAGTDQAFAAVQGEIVANAGNATGVYVPGATLNAPEFPANLPKNFCPIGYVIMNVCSNYSVTTGWQMGVHNTAEASYDSTAKAFLGTYASLMTLPSRPIAV